MFVGVAVFGQLQQQGGRREQRATGMGSAGLGSRVASGALFGSIPQGKATDEVLPLTIRDAVERGLRYNLALTENGEDQRLRRAQRLITLSKLLPEVNIRPPASVQQVHLAAFGFTGVSGIPSVVGPFALVDARATVNQSLLEIRQRRNLKADQENESATL